MIIWDQIRKRKNTWLRLFTCKICFKRQSKWRIILCWQSWKCHWGFTKGTTSTILHILDSSHFLEVSKRMVLQWMYLRDRSTSIKSSTSSLTSTLRPYPNARAISRPLSTCKSAVQTKMSYKCKKNMPKSCQISYNLGLSNSMTITVLKMPTFCKVLGQTRLFLTVKDCTLSTSLSAKWSRLMTKIRRLAFLKR